MRSSSARAARCSALVSAFEAEAEGLLARHDETTCLVVLDDRDALFIAKAETSQAVRLVTRVGSRLPAFAAASGRVLLAALEPVAVDRLLAGVDLVTPVGRRMRLDELHAILERARADGYAENVNETSLGLECMAVPITGAGGATVAAMTLCVPSGRIDRRRRRRMLADLRAAGLRASATLRAIHQPPGTADVERRTGDRHSHENDEAEPDRKVNPHMDENQRRLDSIRRGSSELENKLHRRVRRGPPQPPGVRPPRCGRRACRCRS